MGLSHEQVGPKILAKIKIYILTRSKISNFSFKGDFNDNIALIRNWEGLFFNRKNAYKVDLYSSRFSEVSYFENKAAT